MATTTARRVLEHEADKMMQSSHGRTLVDVRDRLRAGDYYAQWIVDVILQARHRIELVDAYVFARLWSQLMTGRILLARVSVGSGPATDVRREENRAALARLPEPFVAHVHLEQNCAQADGALTWSSAIRVGRFVADDGQLDTVIWPAGSAPLEVGTSDAETTWLHLATCRAVARWPYGSDDIVVLVRPTAVDV